MEGKLDIKDFDVSETTGFAFGDALVSIKLSTITNLICFILGLGKLYYIPNNPILTTQEKFLF